MTSENHSINAALIVDDHSLIVLGAKNIVQMEAPSLEVVVCNTAEQTMRTLHETKYRWSLILLDLDIPGAIGLSLAMEIKKLGLESITCILTGHSRKDFIAQIKANGFRGYILKGSSVDDLESSLKRILSGYKVFPESDFDKPSAPARTLTERQLEILGRVARGKTSKDIAKSLGLQPFTVDTHIKAIMHALDVNSRAEAVRKALELGLLRVDETSDEDGAGS